MMFSPSSAHIAPFCPNNGADAARQYACKYAGKPEKTVDGFIYATAHGPVHTPSHHERHVGAPRNSAPWAAHDRQEGIARIRASPRGFAKLAPSPGGTTWKVIAAVSRNFSNAERWGSV